MWHAKFKIRHKKCWILPKTTKFKISAIGIPLNSFEKSHKRFHTGMVFLKGKKEDKLKFISSLKRDKQIKEFCVKGDQVFALIEGADAISNIFEPSLFFIKPVLMKEGFEYWEIGSWNKRILINFYNKAKKTANVEIIHLKKGIPSVFIQQALPRLTDKQRWAVELAFDLGYYSYPRRISVEGIAKRAKIPRTTFQEHLRKAETRLMNVLIEPLKL